MKELSAFEKEKEFLICVDSDGCAMDTMEIKHIRCFGPCLIREWRLERWAEPVLRRWNEINLYTATRGINRFKALVLLLQEVNDRYVKIEGLAELRQWTQQTAELSNSALEAATKTAVGHGLSKALAWSKAVNAEIKALPPSLSQPYPGVADALAAAYAVADIAVVSSANREAVEEEWRRCELADLVNVVCCQEVGSKAHCISVLAGKGYPHNKILMVGDAPGDLTAAKQNDVFFYPVLTKKETESWKIFREKALPVLVCQQYEELGATMVQEFADNLKMSVSDF